MTRKMSMDKVTLMTRVRAIRACVEHGHVHSMLGTLLTQINASPTDQELQTRKQLRQRAERHLLDARDDYSLFGETSKDIIKEFLAEQDNYILERDTKKQLSIIVQRQLEVVVREHPDYFTKRGRERLFAASTTKRVIGDVFVYLTKISQSSNM